jgi:hypothetical protein
MQSTEISWRSTHAHLLHIFFFSSFAILTFVCVSRLPFGQISLIWAFLKTFSKNKMIWLFGLFLAFSWPFFNLEENGIFLSLFLF